MLFCSDDNCIPTTSGHLINLNSCDVDLLLGQDFCYNFISSNVKRGQIGELIAWNHVKGVQIGEPIA